MLMMQIKVKITLKAALNIVLGLSLISRINSKLLHQMLMMLIRVKIILRVEFSIALESNLN